jgi:hypothetical protein
VNSKQQGNDVSSFQHTSETGLDVPVSTLVKQFFTIRKFNPGKKLLHFVEIG